MSKRITYAKAMEDAAQKRQRYEDLLKESRRTGDRFGINSAERALEKVKSYENVLFSSQEEQKASMGIVPQQPQMVPQAPVEGALPQYAKGARIPATPISVTPKGLTLWDSSSFNRVGPSMGSAGAPMSGIVVPPMFTPFSQTPFGKVAAGAGKLFPYASQFATDMYALRELKNVEAPIDAPMQQAPIMNTTVDISAAKAAMDASTAHANANVDAGLSNSAVVNSVKLATKVNADTTAAGMYQDKYNREQGLRNEQIQALTGTMNQNALIAASNQQQLVDFRNMKAQAKLGIIQGMGVKGAQVGQEFAQRKLDQDKLSILSKQFDSALLSRNFHELGKFGDLYYSNSPQGAQARQQLTVLHTQRPDLKLALKVESPSLYALLYSNG